MTIFPEKRQLVNVILIGGESRFLRCEIWRIRPSVFLRRVPESASQLPRSSYLQDFGSLATHHDDYKAGRFSSQRDGRLRPRSTSKGAGVDTSQPIAPETGYTGVGLHFFPTNGSEPSTRNLESFVTASLLERGSGKVLSSTNYSGTVGLKIFPSDTSQLERSWYTDSHLPRFFLRKISRLE